MFKLDNIIISVVFYL